jgi:hypothetical protein
MLGTDPHIFFSMDSNGSPWISVAMGMAAQEVAMGLRAMFSAAWRSLASDRI